MKIYLQEKKHQAGVHSFRVKFLIAKREKGNKSIFRKIQKLSKIKQGDAEALEDCIDFLESVNINHNTKAANKKIIGKNLTSSQEKVG